MHGNEPAGIVASEMLLEQLADQEIRGKVLLIAGNIQALEKDVRMIHSDLNRVWSSEMVRRDLETGPLLDVLGAEATEMHEINTFIHDLMAEERELIFIDLHTTSSQTVPFITMCDTLINRTFVNGLGVPVVIGIEEYLFHPLLSYVMEKGHTALAYESGQHKDPNSANRHFHFLMLALSKCGVIALSSEEKRVHLKHICFNDSLTDAVFDVRFRQPKEKNDGVKVLPGFSNFDPIERGRKIAMKNGEFIVSAHHCRILMPLYQSLGSDAFFLIGRMPGWWRLLSVFARKVKLYRYINLLIPSAEKVGENRLSVRAQVGNSRLKHILHLVGYRLLEQGYEKWIYIRR
jgi:hypothetical protein